MCTMIDNSGPNSVFESASLVSLKIGLVQWLLMVTTSVEVEFYIQIAGEIEQASRSPHIDQLFLDS